MCVSEMPPAFLITADVSLLLLYPAGYDPIITRDWFQKNRIIRLLFDEIGQINNFT